MSKGGSTASGINLVSLCARVCSSFAHVLWRSSPAVDPLPGIVARELRQEGGGVAVSSAVCLAVAIPLGCLYLLGFTVANSDDPRPPATTAMRPPEW